MSAASRIESLERRVKADPTSVAFASLAEEYRRAGRLGEAIETSRAGLERHPSYASARVTLARALHELGQLDEARAEFETVLGLAPENLVAIRELADIHRRLGDRAATLQYLQQALTLAPLDAELRDAIADAEERMVEAPPHPAAEAVDRPAPVDDVRNLGASLGFEPALDLPIDLPLVEVPADVPAEEQGEVAEPLALDAIPFARVDPSEPESPEDARPLDAPGRLETLRRQEAALEHFLAQILKERDRRAS